MAIVEGLWDCPVCGKKAIKGRYRECTGCGAPRGDQTRFYVGDTTPLSEEEAVSISRNSDWLCSFCGSLNSDDSQQCESCGASKSDSEANYFTMRKRSVMEPPRKIESEESPSFLGTAIPILLCMNALAVLLVLLFAPKAQTVTVDGSQWEYSIAVEELKTFNESDWTLPAGARLLKQQSEIHHYDSVLDHYEDYPVQKSKQVIDHYRTETDYRDLGNGYFDTTTTQVPVYRTEYYTVVEQRPVYRQEPRWQTKYYYEIDRWIVTRYVVTDDSGYDYKWGSVTLAEKEREGSHNETYKLLFTLEEKDGPVQYAVEVEKSIYEQIKKGNTIKVSKSLLGDFKLVEEDE